jgi:DNA-directed RNA polymerase specialized sigma24 family protein
MARALTKTERDGSPYFRPPDIERQIDEVVPLGISELRERLAVTDREASLYLRSETLVHLVRTAILENREDVSSAVLPVLLMRCEGNLDAKLLEGDLPDIASIKEEILSQFSELFADDAVAKHGGMLDYYECRFNRAFRTFRISIVRKEITRLKHLDKQEETDEETFEQPDDALSQILSNLASPATQEWEMLRAPLIEAIKKLPRDERKAVVLVHVLGYKQESEDSNEVTAATRCKCTGKTIYNRLKRAEKKLSGLFKEYV